MTATEGGNCRRRDPRATADTTTNTAGGSLRKRCWTRARSTAPVVLHRRRRSRGMESRRAGGGKDGGRQRQRPQARVRCASAAGRHHTGYDNEHSRGRLCYTERRPAGPFDRLRDCVAGATENGNGRRRGFAAQALLADTTPDTTTNTAGGGCATPNGGRRDPSTDSGTASPALRRTATAAGATPGTEQWNEEQVSRRVEAQRERQRTQPGRLRHNGNAGATARRRTRRRTRRGV